ncbi:transcription termination factor Rho [Alienimonas sp. DA493]|uniref:transcription termination factor Rho n=1 Tax=Alienimonas sp. DA493 TaxID=3373605 RepID=UPI00375524D0
MPSATAAVSDETDIAADNDSSAPRRGAARRRSRAARRKDDSTSEPQTHAEAMDDADAEGFGAGLAEEAEPKPRRKTTRRRTKKAEQNDEETVSEDVAESEGESEGDEEAEPKKAPARRRSAKSSTTRKTAAKKSTTKKAAAKRSRAKKKAEPEEEEIDLSEFDFGFEDDAPPLPINPSAAAAVKPRRSVTVDDDFGVRLPPSVAKNLAVEKLAETLESKNAPAAGSGKKSRRGRRGKKGGGENQPAPAPRGGGKPAPKQGGGEPVTGVLEMHPKGYGFLREAANNYVAQESDPFVSGALVDRFRLREGVEIQGEIGPGNRGQGPRLKLITAVDGVKPEEYDETPKFDALTPINPTEQIVLETGQYTVSTRVMDLLTPLGKGQRALIVAPPRSGKTVLLREMADSISTNHPEVHLIVLLIDERPEEVTEMQRTVNGEVVASSLDHDVESHIRVSQLVIERAKRMAEEGKDVVVLLDSITRLARAFNKWTNSGRVTQGGIDIKALDIPKKLFGTARKFEEGGSVTVVGTVLVETGSRGDDVIFQEFKGTGNMELVLSRALADRRIFPAIDIPQSSTRREELLLDRETHESVNRLRRSLISLPSTQAMEDLSRTLQKFETNEEFLQRVLQVM